MLNLCMPQANGKAAHAAANAKIKALRIETEYASRSLWSFVGDDARCFRPVAPAAITAADDTDSSYRGTVFWSLFTNKFCAIDTARALDRL